MALEPWVEAVDVDVLHHQPHAEADVVHLHLLLAVAVAVVHQLAEAVEAVAEAVFPHHHHHVAADAVVVHQSEAAAEAELQLVVAAEAAAVDTQLLLQVLAGLLLASVAVLQLAEAAVDMLLLHNKAVSEVELHKADMAVELQSAAVAAADMLKLLLKLDQSEVADILVVVEPHKVDIPAVQLEAVHLLVAHLVADMLLAAKNKSIFFL